MNAAVLKALLKEYGILPNKRLGQHFLVSGHALDRIVAAADIKPGDAVIEVGAGPGNLTRVLLEAGARVIAIEKDRRFQPALQQIGERVEPIANSQTNLKTIIADARKWDPIGYTLLANGYKVVSNLPYYASTFLLRRFLAWRPLPERIVVTIQKELAERAAAKPPNMSKLSVMLQLFGRVKLGDKIPRNAFWPQPQVDSRILIFDNIVRPSTLEADSPFHYIVAAGFGHKRKRLLNNLTGVLGRKRPEVYAAFRKLGLSETARAQELSVEQWKTLASKLGV